MSNQDRLSDSLLKDLETYEAEQSAKAIILPLLYALDLPAGVYFDNYSYPIDGLALFTSEGNCIGLSDHHDQDYCENVYADWSYAKPFLEQDFKTQQWCRLEVLGIVDLGFMLKFHSADHKDETVNFTIPCYNSQNGYYSDALDLVIKYSNYPTASTSINLSGYKKDNIN